MHCRAQGTHKPDIAALAREYRALSAEDLVTYVRVGKLACLRLRAGSSRGFATTAAQTARVTVGRLYGGTSSSLVGSEHATAQLCLAASARLEFLKG